MKLRIYVEGSAGPGQRNNKAQQSECRRAFAAFFTKAGLKDRLPSVIPCGGRHQAMKDFSNAVKHANGEELPLLLVDSEDLIKGAPDGARARQHLEKRDAFVFPACSPDQFHLMVVETESWFLADRAMLRQYYKSGFKEAKLPSPTTSIESVTKEKVNAALAAATRDTKAGTYHKGRDQFELLSRLDPELLLQDKGGPPWARRFIEAVRALAGST